MFPLIKPLKELIGPVMFVYKYSWLTFKFALQMRCLKDILIKLKGGSSNKPFFIGKEIQIKVLAGNIVCIA